MINILLNRIKELEQIISDIEYKNFKATEILNSINHPKVKEAINLLAPKSFESFFDGSFLSFHAFLELIKQKENFYLIMIDANMPKIKQKFLMGYLTNKFSPVFTLKDGVIYGIITKDQIDKIKKTNNIPFFNQHTEEFDEIDLFKVLFFMDSFSFSKLKKAQEVFSNFRQRPSFKNKRFIVYSLQNDRVVDFEAEELNKQKEKYRYIYNENYPHIEAKLKQEKDNIPFILAVLEKIDYEMDDIKKSRGVLNVVNRILNYIELNTKEEEIRNTVKLLRNNLKDY